MSDDHGTPGLTSQAEEWRARAQRNREEAERKRRRALDTNGGISVAEMLARHAAERPSAESNGRARPSRQRRRAAEQSQPDVAATSVTPAISATPSSPSRHAADDTGPAPTTEFSGHDQGFRPPEAVRPAPPRRQPPERPSAPAPSHTPPQPDLTRRTTARPDLARPEPPHGRALPRSGSDPVHPQPPHPPGPQPRGPEPMRSGHFFATESPDEEPPKHVPVRGDGPPPGRPLPDRPPRVVPQRVPGGQHPSRPPYPPNAAQPVSPQRPAPPASTPPTPPAPPAPQSAAPLPSPTAPPENHVSSILDSAPRRPADTPPPPTRAPESAAVRRPAPTNGNPLPPNGAPRTRRAIPAVPLPPGEQPFHETAVAAPAEEIEAAESAAPATTGGPEPARGRPPAPPRPRRRPAPEPPERSLEDRLTMTDQMEPVDDATMYRRRIDDSLARFSAAHDELEAEEQQKRQKRQRLFDQTMTALQRVVPAASRSQRRNRRSHTTPDDADGEPAPADSESDRADRESESDDTAGTRTATRPGERHVAASRATAVVIAVLVFVATGVGWGAKTWFESQFNEITALDENSADIRKAAAQLGDENFLIVGSDTREGASADDNVGTGDMVEGARSDTVMLAHVPKDRNRAVVISFPRDLEITRPECQRWDSATGTYDEVLAPTEAVKLNTAFNIGGPRCVTKVIQQISGMKINHFVGIDFQGFKGMVDAVGGVPIHLDEPMKDAELGLIVAETGDVLLKGDQALSFVRARKVYGDPTFSDYGRMQRQQQFLSALLSKVMSSDVLFDMGRLTGFVEAFGESTFGENIGVDQMLTLAQSMREMNTGKVTFQTVPTVGDANERGNEVLLEADSDELFEALIENTPLPGEQAERENMLRTDSGFGTSQQAAAPA